ncbi:MAG: PAS domain S-box protein [Halobacteriota archaeon]|nr:PAS domain S-box protein [Halobacteriota archaeon]
MFKIMAVDDEAVITMQLEEHLTTLGYEVVESASSGEEAIDMARDLRPDIILMDIVMPGKFDGIDASRMIKEELDIPVIFLTAHADDELVNKAKAVEPFGYIIKPFQEKEIKAAIEIAIYKKEMDRRLYRSEKRYRSLVDTASEAIISVDSSENIVSWNSAAVTLFGYTTAETIGKPFTSFALIRSKQLDEKLDEDNENSVDRTPSTERSDISEDAVEYFGYTKDGSEFPVDLSMDFCWTGEEVFSILFVRDNTKRERIEESLRSSVEVYRKMIEQANDSIGIIQDGEVKFVNAKFAELLGYSREELKGKNIFGISTYTNAQFILELNKRRIMGDDVPSIYQTELLTKKEKKIPIEANCTVIKYKGRPAELLYVRDLRERKKIDRKLNLFLYEKGALTDRQRSIIKTALEKGFYEYPKKIDLKGLAKEFDISISTASEIIRRGERNILKQYFGIE